MSDNTHEESTGPIKTGKQFFWISAASFVVPFFTIVALVMWINSGNLQSPGSTDPEQKVETRIQPVSSVRLAGDEDSSQAQQEADSAPQQTAQADDAASGAADSGSAPGQALYEQTCAACHGTGAAGAPKYGDKDAWEPLIASGMDAMMDVAVHGKGAMPPRGGSQASDDELHATVLYMASAADPDAAQKLGLGDDGDKAAGDAGESKTNDTDKTGGDASEAKAKETDDGAKSTAAGDNIDLAAGKELYEKTCFACHGTGAAGAPKYGDKEAWEPLIASGMDAMMDVAINGKGAMPPRGGSQASDDELHAAVQYMINAAQ